MINGQSAGIDGDQWAQVGNVPGLRCDPPLNQGDSSVAGCLILAHGAGAPMDSGFMEDMAQRLAGQGVAVVRFEFPYMAQRRVGGGKRPPNPQKVLLEHWREVYRQVRPLVAGRLAIGGKSMGGRMASLVAAELETAGTPVRGAVYLGYPFHAPGKPMGSRDLPLGSMHTPTLLLQGERDPFGTRAEVDVYAFGPGVTVEYLPDGDHSFAPRKASGRTAAQNLDAAVDAIVGFMERL